MRWHHSLKRKSVGTKLMKARCPQQTFLQILLGIFESEDLSHLIAKSGQDHKVFCQKIWNAFD